uniref:Corticotropin-releasing factor domain-containing protein n=1 Tax=Anopheles christyi TaxID=43041 RepID=A0A182K8K0_9DIPT
MTHTPTWQENSLFSLKRTKPSLSIVNPLDVLRQRIILEMARRQMRENTRQTRQNRAHQHVFTVTGLLWE